jgi:hypothetical protein
MYANFFKNIWRLKIFGVSLWCLLQHKFLGQNQLKIFEQDNREAYYGGGMETTRSHKRPAYVVIDTPTVGFFFYHNSYRYVYD